MAKKTNTFLNDIKNYDLIREMLHHIYLYGNYSKGDIVKNNIAGSERSVYDMINRIKNYLDGEYLTTHKLPNRKQDKQGYRFRYDPFQCPINYLADTYRNCSYVVEDFIFYFTLLQAFKPYEKHNPYKQHKIDAYSSDVSELTLEGKYSYDTLMSNFHDILTANEDILQILGQSNANSPDNSEAIFTPAKARDRLNELVECGIIIKEEHTYALAPDLLENYEEWLESILLMVQFFYNYSDLCIPGYYLAHTLSQYSIVLGANESPKMFFEQENPVFFYKNSSIQNVIDDHTMWTIINAMHGVYPISLNYKNKDKVVHSYDVYPIKIIIERQYGRHYLFAYNYAYENFIMFRIDSISNISPSENIEKSKTFPFLESTHDLEKQLNETYHNYMKNVWNTTASDTLYDILIHFSCDKSNYSQLLSRVSATGRNGTIIPINDTSFDYKTKVTSYIEMKPWIRGFGEYAIVDKDASPELFEEIRNDYRKACASYGII